MAQCLSVCVCVCVCVHVCFITVGQSCSPSFTSSLFFFCLSAGLAHLGGTCGQRLTASYSLCVCVCVCGWVCMQVCPCVSQCFLSSSSISPALQQAFRLESVVQYDIEAGTEDDTPPPFELLFSRFNEWIWNKPRLLLLDRKEKRD